MPRTKGIIKSKKTSKKIPKKNKGGRPSKFKPEMIEQIELLCRTGRTLAMVSKELGVSEGILIKWRDDKPEVFDAIKKGQYAFDTGRIQKTMVEKALGIQFDETTEEYIDINGEYFIETMVKQEMGKDKDGNKVFKQVKTLVQGIKRKIIHKMIPPSDVLMMFWLQNRMPDEWKNVQRQLVEQTTTVEHNHTYDLTKLGRKELERLKSLVEKAKDDDASDDRGSGLRLSVG